MFHTHAEAQRNRLRRVGKMRQSALLPRAGLRTVRPRRNESSNLDWNTVPQDVRT
jgi:hypothetical protein